MMLPTLFTLLQLICAPSSPGGEEWLYAYTGNGLQVYDPETGEHLQSSYIPSLVLNKGLVYDGGRLYMMNQNAPFLRDFMVEMHPATSQYDEIGKTGLSIWWSYVSLARDPTTDMYYVQAADETYQVDMKSGKLTYLGRLEQGVTIIRAVAIDSQGRAFGYGAPSLWYPNHALYKVDLYSGDLELIGDLKGSPVLFTTLTFDAQDRLWGSGYGPFTQQIHRLYRIDLETLELHSTFSFPEEFPGVSAIAFGPKPDVTTYCEPKTNSQGCTPAISWMGHPSASAPFGFNVSCSQVVPDAPGFLMLGFGGQASLPFQGGTLCVGDPIVRTTPQASGGSTGCDGAWQLDVNTWLFKNSPMNPGDRFTCQWWGRDPGLVGRDSSQLSDALEVVLLP